jgi:hypothetical protein
MVFSDLHRPVISCGQRGRQEGEKLSGSDKGTSEKTGACPGLKSGMMVQREGSPVRDQDRSLAVFVGCAFLNGGYPSSRVAEAIERPSDGGIVEDEARICHAKVVGRRLDAVDFDCPAIGWSP